MRFALVALLLLVSCDIPAQSFECTTDESCGEGGVCEAEGYCSAFDATCTPSNRRFVGSSPAALAGTCVATCAEEIVAGYVTTCVKTAAGDFICWGANDSGQLGLGTADAEPHPLPGAVAGAPAGASSLALGQRHACVVRPSASSGEEIACWGANDAGQLGGEPSVGIVHAPQLVGPGVAVAAGNLHACAVLASGNVACWGDNLRGQLGDDTRGTPHVGTVLVEEFGGATFTGAVRIAASSDYTCTTGSPAPSCWGGNEGGQLGNQAIDDIDIASRVTGPMGGDRPLATGGMHACIAQAAGVQCWGDNAYGQLGRVTSGNHLPAGAVEAGPATALGVAAGERHTCAIDGEDGTVWCWGDNADGQLGTPAAGAMSVAPVQVPGVTGATSIAAGATHTCVVTSDGRVRCWGGNGRGQLGDGTTTKRPEPVRARVACPQ